MATKPHAVQNWIKSFTTLKIHIHNDRQFISTQFGPDSTKIFIGELQIVANCSIKKLNKEFTPKNKSHPNIMKTLNSIQFRSSNTRKLTSKQERNNQYILGKLYG